MDELLEDIETAFNHVDKNILTIKDYKKVAKELGLSSIAEIIKKHKTWNNAKKKIDLLAYTPSNSWDNQFCRDCVKDECEYTLDTCPHYDKDSVYFKEG